MAKDRDINPAQAQRKADKQKEIRRNKQTQQAARHEKLARRNPERVRAQIDDLKALEQTRGGAGLRPKEKETLAQLERDLRDILKTRDADGQGEKRKDNDKGKGDVRREQAERRETLGKRRWEQVDPYESDTDPEVRDIPMPRDTPPPIPRRQVGGGEESPGGNAPPPKPKAASQAVYSSAPQLRDLSKESLQFVPTTVAKKKQQIQGHGRLLEPEEMDKLERAGYLKSGKQLQEERQRDAKQDEPAEDIDAELQRLEAEIGGQEAQPGRPRTVQLEEVADEGD